MDSRALTEDEIAYLQSIAAQTLHELEKETKESSPSDISSWLTGTKLSPNDSHRCRFFHQQGFLLVPNFVDSSEISALKQQMETLVKDQWDPQAKTMGFGTDEESNQTQTSDDYFLESASRVHYFAEEHALDPQGALLPEYYSNKLLALNKAGHGMHLIHPGAFSNYATSDQVRELVSELKWQHAVIPQSMYIFKQACIGGAVNSHQDSTFLYTTPRQSCLGLWLALDDATLQNGCLWVRPKSHVEPVRRRLTRNVEYFGSEAIQQGSNIPNGDVSKPKMIMETMETNHYAVLWDGLLPEGSEPPCLGLVDAGFVPVECKAGDLVCFPGELDHLSLPNTSHAPRHTFQLHLVEGPEAGVTWAKTNWLQYPNGTPFLSTNK